MESTLGEKAASFLKKLTPRKRTASNPVAIEIRPEKVFLEPSMFVRNYEAGAIAKGQELNPGAGDRGEELHRLVELGEEVVSFTGTGEQAIAFVKAAQANPLVDVDRQKTFGHGCKELQRTGVQLIVRPFTYGKEKPLYPENPEKVFFRTEIIGLQVEETGYYTISLLTPRIWSSKGIYNMDQLRDEHYFNELAEKDVEFRGKQHRGEFMGKSEMEIYLEEDPVLQHFSDELDTLKAAMARGAFVLKRYDQENPSGKGVTHKFMFEERKPFFNQKINIFYEEWEIGLNKEELQNVMRGLVVPEEAARNLPK